MSQRAIELLRLCNDSDTPARWTAGQSEFNTYACTDSRLNFSPDNHVLSSEGKDTMLSSSLIQPFSILEGGLNSAALPFPFRG